MHKKGVQGECKKGTSLVGKGTSKAKKGNKLSKKGTG
jgi:hypothetical protein